MQIVEMTADDYDGFIELVRQTEGMVIREADSRDAIIRYLARNPGMSFVAREEGHVVAGVLGGHDGRRGYLNHLAVDKLYRGQGLARALVGHCVDRLEREGIHKVHIDVLTENGEAQEFWTNLGWSRRDDLVRFSYQAGYDGNA